ncbi:pentatricopeptide repeat-containing protein At4g18975, chloroplastic [Punica granatum]|uniref:Pentatricopeptide repeat-containing protein At4g18975, chloroplastic n=1 Tax=Punica granatum TaxID=22663 RepID=A0A6P8CJK5_PUNGR|nr:pentatricopeptide repeat-containing protein At4g18975, chloroplastic [Punica granatum]XP_031383446.1 pentatricopeptide repeat-containing protein At4g18975, chloroplastic [Punica granatum]XP_031383447.1 pentatricopeptide repeat-containing protein At4g18975, chloroplastic [Punica granatum]XP_031383448.1 pentatricopeptide repeat-containing protein At4g18975, chloroplastic [Punica granatum]XP_031383449.1 pentatricopeptide repeat-containing protein At4g18975, chloroplastic [Punica granatum]XP_03
MNLVFSNEVMNTRVFGFSKCGAFTLQKPFVFPLFRAKEIHASSSKCGTSSSKCFHKNESMKSSLVPGAVKETMVKKIGKREHHVWKKRDSAGSGQKALNLLRIISDLPNEKEAVYGALDKWIAWETEFPLIAAAKALKILRKRSQWRCVIQVAKWMLSKGQGATMGTYDTLLLAFDMDQRVDEAESLWNMIVHAHTRSISKRLFSRMISLYDHHDMPDKIIEVFADMEELSVRPDEDTVRRVARAFRKLGEEEKQKIVLKRYLSKYKYAHFKGERVRVKRFSWDKE